MAEPIDSAVFLEDASEIVQQQYFGTYLEQYHDRFGSTTNKLFMPDPMPVTGDGVNIQYEVGPADSVRFQTDPLGEISAPQRIDPGTIKIRWNRQTLTSHDFTQVSARCQFDIYTIENHAKGSIVDLADRIYNNIQKDYDEKLAIMRHSPRSGQIGLVNGTPRQGDGYTYAGSTATATNATGMRIQLDNGSIATMRPNARYDFLNPTTFVVNAGNVRCTDIPNFADRSARFEFMTTGLPGELSTGNIANVADNDLIVFSGMYNKNLWSLGAWYSTPTEAETFMCGVDRTDVGYQWMIPQRSRDAGTATTITKAMFNDAAISMGFLGEDPQNATTWMSDPTIHQTLRDAIGEDAFIQWPLDDARAKRFANFGSVGLNYQHGTFGTVKIVADPLALPTRVLILVNDTWKTLSYGWQGLKPVQRAGGHWYWMNQGTPNTGQGLIKCADWVGNIADFCTRAWKNGCILAVTA